MWSYCWVHIWHQSAQKGYHTRLKLKPSFTNTFRQQTRLRFKDVDESFGRRSKCADTRFPRGFKKSKHCEDVKWTLQARQRHSISETKNSKEEFLPHRPQGPDFYQSQAIRGLVASFLGGKVATVISTSYCWSSFVYTPFNCPLVRTARRTLSPLSRVLGSKVSSAEPSPGPTWTDCSPRFFSLCRVQTREHERPRPG